MVGVDGTGLAGAAAQLRCLPWLQHWKELTTFSVSVYVRLHAHFDVCFSLFSVGSWASPARGSENFTALRIGLCRCVALQAMKL
jgi:hypothetical protein